MFRNRITLEDGESLACYLYRLSNVNRYPSISTLASCLKTTAPKLNNNEFTWQHLNEISKLSRINIKDLYTRSSLMLQELLGEYFDKLILKNKVKYCPLCLREQALHKQSWCLLPLNLCVEHNTLLIDHCKKCGARINLTSLMSGSCNCGFEYKYAVSLVEVDFCCIEAQLKLYEGIFGVETPLFPFNLDLQHFIKLVLNSYHILDGLNGFVGNRGKLKIFHNCSRGSRQNNNHYHAFNNAYWMYQEFSHHFPRLIDEFLKKTNPKVMYYRKARFERLFELDAYKEIHKAYDSFWLGKVDQGVIRKDFSVFKKKPELLEQRSYISKDEIRTTLGTSYEKIEQLGNDNVITLKTNVQRNRKRYQVNKRSFSNVVQGWNNFITRQEAAQVLGIQRNSIPKLIKAGLLRTNNTGAERSEMLSREEVMNLLNECRGRYTRKKVNGLKLHEALIKYSVNGLSIVRILQFTKEGKLNPLITSESDTLAGNIYKVYELEKCINIIKEEQQAQEGYSLSEVIKVLHVGERKAKEWIDAGILVPEKISIQKGGRKCRLFKKQSIDSVGSKILNNASNRVQSRR